MDEITTLINAICDNMYNAVKSLQIRRRKCNISNIFRTMIMSSFGDNKEENFRCLYTKNRKLSKSSFSYWRSKIYSLQFDDNYHDYAIDNNITNQHIEEEYKHLYNKYNILVADGTKTKCAYRNKCNREKNIASINLVYLYDLLHNTFRDYKIAYDNNEQKTLLLHDFTKKDVIILDRGYSSYTLMHELKKRTNFIIRLKSDLTIYKKFMEEDRTSKVIVYEGTRLKLVKYRIDKKTKKIIINKYKNDNNSSEEDLSEYYVLATNIISLTPEELIYLYKKRWSIEVAFKHLKQNFRIRYVCRYLRSKNPLNKCIFWYNLSTLMFNLSSILKNTIDTEKNIDCKFSDCCRLVREMLSGTIHENLVNDEIDYIIKNKYYPKKNTHIYNDRKRITSGKSINRIDKFNDELDALEIGIT